METTTQQQDIIVFRFLEDRRFPKFSMKAGDKWRIRGTKKPSEINNMAHSGYFQFAGGECRKSDIEVLYFGTDQDTADYFNQP